MTSLTSAPTVTTSVVAGVARVRLSRPDKLNALTLAMIDELVSAARLVRRDRSVRVVVLSGEGDAFCAGLDLRAALGDPRGIATRFVPRPWPWPSTNTFQEVGWAWRRLPVPVIAVVHGHCLGAGLQLALGADLRVSTADAQWSVREARWGLVPDMSGTRTLTEVVGLDVAKDLTLTARTVDGTEAHRLGLVTRVAGDLAAAHGVTDELVSQLVAHDRGALASAKRLLDGAARGSAHRAFARERRAQLGLLRRLDRSGLPGR
ncbi:crotonase/enoyl-CoA hydratase family protein [Ornithinimicrobium tianjinense]|uniref:Enoyl-CoA hydratase/isomerase family protein n=1 Tax=Ornithinimicrobium tianjinense TaxID=1195761 RepID=A0A917F2I8_9MICO|nr:crotonase/enoyl-CoA hydratase family protein [Ornithinimicrobium tianjinense]GGF36605.1 enoyl-CoA hydratase/isomerase family protein [Ornithinimicrobium tianjinense]